MKITDVRAYTLDAFRTNWTFIKVETDEGIYGWGEASLGTRENALEGCVEDMNNLYQHLIIRFLHPNVHLKSHFVLFFYTKSLI